ncbi:MAG: GAF domain-containing protein [Hormoscilla sp.]
MQEQRADIEIPPLAYYHSSPRCVSMIDSNHKLFCRLDGLTTQERDSQRLAALTQLGLLSAQAVPVFEEATQTATYYLDVPICILSFMIQDEQRFKAAVGLSRLGLMNQLAASRKLSRRDSLCSYVTDSGQPLAIADIATEPTLSESILYQHYGIRAYLGVPLFSFDGLCLGSLAVMDLVPRTFTSKEVRYLEITARWSMSEFERDLLRRSPQLADREGETGSETGSETDTETDTEKTAGETGSETDTETDTEKTAGETDTEETDREQSVITNNRSWEKIPIAFTPQNVNQVTTDRIKEAIQGKLVQELRTPLTSVKGMASVLLRETYGPLTDKQKKYLQIIHHSGEQLMWLVNEIVELDSIDKSIQQLQLTAVDMEILCQQVSDRLSVLAQERSQKIRLSVEPKNRTWRIDSLVVRQIMYQLVSNAISSAPEASLIRLHASGKKNALNIAVWVERNAEGLADKELDPAGKTESPVAIDSTSKFRELNALPVGSVKGEQLDMGDSSLASNGQIGELDNGTRAPEPEDLEKSQVSGASESLKILLCRELVRIHGGQFSIQGSESSGYRYVVSLPKGTKREDK